MRNWFRARGNTDELEARVREATKRREQLSKQLAAPHKGSDLTSSFMEACEAVADAKRRLAAAQGLDWAEPLEWPAMWDVGAPSPHVVASGTATLLIYLVNEPDPAWDGTYANVIDPSAPAAMPLATVEFERCYSHRFGGPNDEVFSGHPLAERGFSNYGAYLVHNSRWVEEARATNSVHAMYNAETWTKMRHYLLAFHDEVFECLAYDHHVEVTRESFSAALARCARRVVE